MRVLIAALAVAAVLSAPLSARGQQISLHDVAPADEYFGKLQMSVLGIRNELATISTRIDREDAADAELAGVEMIEDSIRDWAQKYPRDNWLDRYAVGLEKVYARIPTMESRMRLAGFAQWIHERFTGQPLDAHCSDVATKAFALPGDTPEAAPSPEPSPAP